MIKSFKRLLVKLYREARDHLEDLSSKVEFYNKPKGFNI